VAGRHSHLWTIFADHDADALTLPEDEIAKKYLAWVCKANISLHEAPHRHTFELLDSLVLSFRALKIFPSGTNFSETAPWPVLKQMLTSTGRDVVDSKSLNCLSFFSHSHVSQKLWNGIRVLDLKSCRFGVDFSPPCATSRERSAQVQRELSFEICTLGCSRDSS
jgi:hypothetical protein